MEGVVLVIGQLPPPVHGTNVMAERFMGAVNRSGYRAVIVEKRFSETLEEVEVPSLRKVLKIPALARKLASSIRHDKPAMCIFFISVGWTSFLVDSLLALILKSHGIPYILYFHGAGYRQYEQRGSSMRHLVRRVLSGALGGIVLGQRLKADVTHCITEDRLYVLPNGIPDVNHSHPVAKRKDAGVVTVLFLSNLVDFKGPMEFLKMAKYVIERQDHVRFVMAGRPASREYLEKLTTYVRENGLSDHVSFPGEVRGLQKEELFRSAHIFTLPTFKDTFGLVNVEAMQWSLPVISSSQGSIPDVVQDGISGFIIEPGNTEQFAGRVLSLVNDSEMRTTMGEAGRRAYESRYSLEAYEKNVHDALTFFMNMAQLREARP